jgi:hypothetical protein
MESPAFYGERSRTKGGAFYLDKKSEKQGSFLNKLQKNEKVIGR